MKSGIICSLEAAVVYSLLSLLCKLGRLDR